MAAVGKLNVPESHIAARQERKARDKAVATKATASGDQAVPSDADTLSPARRQAAAALKATGIRKGKAGARAATRAAKATSGKAVDVTSWGEFVMWFAGSVIGVVLLNDLLSAKGSAGFAGASKAAGGIAHRVIEPVPIVKANT